MITEKIVSFLGGMYTGSVRALPDVDFVFSDLTDNVIQLFKAAKFFLLPSIANVLFGVVIGLIISRFVMGIIHLFH